MFQNMPIAMLERMRELEEIDAWDRSHGTPHVQRLRQIPPETGRFLAILAAGTPEGALIEIGTSAGYSTMWLSLAAAATGRRVTTFEVTPAKVALARETFAAAGVEHLIDLIEGDGRDHLAEIGRIAFCFLDAEKDIYEECYELVVPALVSGGLLVADNAVSHHQELQPMIDRAIEDPRVDVVLIPIGKGELICRKN